MAEVAVPPGPGAGGTALPGAVGGRSAAGSSGPLQGPELHAALSTSGSCGGGLPLPQALASSLRRFTQNLSVFRRDVAEALRSEGSTEPCGLDMMS